LLRYGDSYRDNKPDCFGRSSYFSSRDPECHRCEFYDDCHGAVRGSRVRPVSSVRPIKVNTPRPADGATSAKGEAGVIRDGETASQRFVKDCATGACRGAAWEAYQFFCNFRF
jgi:hypothetical protein